MKRGATWGAAAIAAAALVVAAVVFALRQRRAPMPEWKPLDAELKNTMWFKDAPTPCEDAPDKRMQLQVKAFRDKILG